MTSVMKTGDQSTSKGSNDAMDEETRKEKRRAANRRSARKSRYREMVMLDELQRNTRELTTQNSGLRQENESLRGLISSIKTFTSDAHQIVGLGSLLTAYSKDDKQHTDREQTQPQPQPQPQPQNPAPARPLPQRLQQLPPPPVQAPVANPTLTGLTYQQILAALAMNPSISQLQLPNGMMGNATSLFQGQFMSNPQQVQGQNQGLDQSKSQGS